MHGRPARSRRACRERPLLGPLRLGAGGRARRAAGLQAWQKVGGQWRIAKAPPDLLLTQLLVPDDYQLRNLYFFDPLTSFLVPDPVYVPLRRPRQPDGRPGVRPHLAARDWLSRGATKTAFPAKTTMIGDVTLTAGPRPSTSGGAIAKAARPTPAACSKSPPSCCGRSADRRGRPGGAVGRGRGERQAVEPAGQRPEPGAAAASEQVQAGQRREQAVLLRRQRRATC